MSALLDDVIDRLAKLKPEERKALVEQTMKKTEDMIWVPNPGPQTLAYYSPADVLLFGGEPGGGKSFLLLGLAFTAHRRSLLVRRTYSSLGRLTDDAIKINGGRNGFNGSAPPQFKLKDGRQIKFGAAERPGDEEKLMGDGVDFIGFDEATQFARSQITFLMGWLRTDIRGQRTRVVLATNPPLRSEGMWIIEMFAPWIDEKHPNPALPGELRWFITDEDGKDVEVKGPEPIEFRGKQQFPKSRTYFPSSVRDNPYYASTDYESQLLNMDEPWRSILLGGFKSLVQDTPNQAIPTEWVRAAQARWKERPPDRVPMCSLGVDASGGGTDPMVIAPRYDGWYAPLIEIPAKEIPKETSGNYCAGIIIANRRDRAGVVVDMGGGYGGPIFEHLIDNDCDVRTYTGSATATARTRDGQLSFKNVRTQSYWRFREALDPDQPGGSPIALPPDDRRLFADLTAPTFEVKGAAIELEPKKKVVERLGRSTDRGDAVVMAYTYGPTYVTHGPTWANDALSEEMGGGSPRGRRRPQVVMGRSHRRH